MRAEQNLSEVISRGIARVCRVLTLAAIVLLPATARAQVEPIDPVWMVVTRDTPMRCGDEPTFYKVATLKRGSVVRMDAKNLRYGRVEYPRGMYAFVARNDAEVLSDKALKLASEDSTIRSPNSISGLAGSWRSLYFGSIKPGAELEIIAPVKTPSGQVTGYKIVPPRPPVAPHPPYGYVELSAMREATPEEVKTYLDSLKEKAEQPAEVSPEQPGPGKAEKPSAENEAAGQLRAGGGGDASGHAGVAESASEEKPASGIDAEQAENVERQAGEVEEGGAPGVAEPEPDTSLLQEMVMPGDEAAPEAATEPADGAEGESVESAAGQAGAEKASEKEAAQPKQDWLGWNELESMLIGARAAGRETLEGSLEELIAEYSRSLSHAETEPMRRALRSRLDWLRLRKVARDKRLELDAALSRSKELDEQARERIRRWHSGRYDIVGRLVPSAVYDGRRLPRMYRVRAAGETGLVRTIGYLRDVPSLDLESKVGHVVGVVGKARFDEALHVRVITPARIDILRPAESSTPADTRRTDAPGGEG